MEHNRQRPDLVLAEADAQRGAFIYDEARVGGLMVFAPSGWGKSRLLGRAICHQDALRGVGTVVFDVVGETLANALDRLLYLPEPLQRALIKRIRYVNMGGQELPDGTVVVPSWPMLTKRRKSESLYTTAARIADLIRQTDQKFADATIQGLKRTEPLLIAVCKVLAALELPISAADDLLTDPEAWVERIDEAVRSNPQAKSAQIELGNYLALDRKERELRSEPFRNRLQQIRHNEVIRAMMASTRPPSIDWDSLVNDGLQLYLDFSEPMSAASREIALFWVWNSLMDYIQSRKGQGRDFPPLSLVVDELSYFVRGTQLNTAVIISEIAELLEVRARNSNCWVTFATQSMRQLPDELLATCLQMKSHLYGAITDYEQALDRARRWFRKDPKMVKDVHRIWATETSGGAFMSPVSTNHFVIDTQNVYYPLDEQDYLNSRNFAELEKGQWYLAAATREGEVPKTVTKITTNRNDPQQYIQPENRALIAKLQSFLMQLDGHSVSAVLEEIEQVSLMAGTEASIAPPLQAERCLPAPQSKPTGRIRTL